MKLVITGGAGFVGLHLCRQLNSKFEKITVIDIVPISYEEYPENIEYLNIDVRDFDALNNAFKDVDYVIHSAVAAMPFRTPKEIFDININGTRNVLEAGLRNNVKCVIFLSSMVVYGMTDKSPIPETAPLVGTDAYSKSKIYAEKICEEYRKKGLCIPVIRTRTILGTERLGIFTLLYDWVKSGAKIPLIGNGKNHYQLLDVEDLVDAIYLILKIAPSEKVNTVFNAGAEKFGTIEEDINQLCQFAKTGAKPLKTYSWLVKIILKVLALLGLSPLHEWVYDMACKDTYYSIEKLKSIGWKPKYSNACSLIKSYKWYLENYKKIKLEGITNRSPWSGGILDFAKLILRIL
ncbi:MAG: NAD-dependent epimerase/dehydratase family protein [Endomicrobiia bacterium]